MEDAGASGFCDIAASCLCGGQFVQAGNIPADGVLEANVTSAYIAQITATFGDTAGFSVGDSICVDQSAVGATILVPIQNGADAAHVVLVPDGETCVPNFAYTVQLDDGGRPLACNAGVESQIPLTEQQAVAALRAQSCTASLGAVDSRWSENQCVAPGGCNASGSPTAIEAGAAIAIVALLALARRFRFLSAR